MFSDACVRWTHAGTFSAAAPTDPKASFHADNPQAILFHPLFAPTLFWLRAPHFQVHPLVHGWEGDSTRPRAKPILPFISSISFFPFHFPPTTKDGPYALQALLWVPSLVSLHSRCCKGGWTWVFGLSLVPLHPSGHLVQLDAFVGHVTGEQQVVPGLHHPCESHEEQAVHTHGCVSCIHR